VHSKTIISTFSNLVTMGSMKSSPIKLVNDSKLHGSNVGVGNVIHNQGDDNATANASTHTTVSIFTNAGPGVNCLSEETDKKLITLALGSLNVILLILLVFTLIAWKRASRRAKKISESMSHHRARGVDIAVRRMRCNREEERLHFTPHQIPNYAEISSC